MLTRDLAVRCVCRRGLVHHTEGWADPCGLCGGRGSIALAALAHRLNENETTLRRLTRGRARMRSKTALRILDKILALIGG